MKQLLAFSLLTIVASLSAAPNKSSPPFADAQKISADGGGISFLVMLDGKIVAEDYPTGNKPTHTSELASGTKSFSGVLALCAVEDGLLKLDERVSDTITEWKSDPVRRDITIRHLLTLTSGIPGGKIGRPPSYKDAINEKSESAPGEKFSYGPAPFQIFGEVLRRKLARKNETVMGYLEKKILRPLGIKPGNWRKDADGQPHLPSGASLSARDWAKFGEMVRLDGAGVLPAGKINQLFKGTTANAGYGLTWWLPASGRMGANSRTLREKIAPHFPRDIYVAAGLGGQVLVVIPSLKLVAVRQAPVRMSKDSFEETKWIEALIRGAKTSAAQN